MRPHWRIAFAGTVNSLTVCAGIGHFVTAITVAAQRNALRPRRPNDDGFFAALQELVAYAFGESVRIKKQGGFFPRWKEIPSRSSGGILQEMQSLLQKYRDELVSQSRLLDQEDPA